MLCASGLKGGSHTRRGAVYTGHCSLCGESNLVSEYHGETGDSAYARMETHKQDVEGKKDSNAFHKHLELNHPEHIQDLGVFKMKVEKTFSKPLDRQIFEGTLIAENERRDHLLNSKMQFHEPSVPRVTVTRQLGNWQLIVRSTFIFENLTPESLIIPLGPARDPELLFVTKILFSPHYSFDKAGDQRKASACKIYINVLF